MKGGLLKSVFTVGSLTALSRLLGFVREMLQSRLIGAGVEQSAFVLAFAIPNMTRKLFGEGALTAAFVPIFKGELENGEIEAARKLARSVMTMVMLVLGSVVVLGVVAFTGILECSTSLSPRTGITLRLVRILFPYMVFICGAAFGMGVLNALGRFVEGAFMPALLNVVWILALIGLWFFPGLSVSSRVSVVCWAILCGGAAQMIFLFYCMAKKGFSPRPLFGYFRNEKVRLVWKNTFIAAMGAGAVQLNYMLDQVLGQCAAPWAAGVIGFAERLMDLPIGVVGVAFGTVLLPTFSGHFAKGDADGARRALNTSIKHMMLLMVPASLVAFFASDLIVWLIYQGGRFDAAATTRVARALSVYALGLCFIGIQKCLIPYFQAQKDMKTPLRATLITVGLNATLNIVAVIALPQEWRHVGLAASTSLCAAIGCALLWRKLR